MKNTRFICLFLIIALLTSSVGIVSIANETETYGYVQVRKYNSGEELNCVSVMKNGEIFLTVEDIAKILDLQVGIDDGQISFWNFVDRMFRLEIIDLINFEEQGIDLKEYGIDWNTKDKKFVRTNGRSYLLDFIEKDSSLFLPLEKLLYLCHAQWSVEENTVVVTNTKLTLLDFVNKYTYRIFENVITSEDIDDVTSATSRSLALMFNDFDYKVFIPIWGANKIVDDTYKEALLQLTNEDTAFLNKNEQAVKELLGENYYTKAKSDFENMSDIVDIPKNAFGTLDDIQKITRQIQDANNSTKFNKFNNISFLTNPQYNALSIHLDQFSTATQIMDATFDVIEVATRSLDWSQDFINQLEIISHSTADFWHAKQVKNNADKLIKEKQAPLEAMAEEAMWQAIELLSKKAIGEHPVGKVLNVFQAGLAIAKMVSPSLKDKMDAHEQAYMITNLIRVERIAQEELFNAYSNVISNNNVTHESIQQLRNTLMLALKTNLRNSFFIDYLKKELDNKYSLPERNFLQNKIAQNYAWIIELAETEVYDELLVLGEFNSMYSDKLGNVRVKITEEVVMEEAINYIDYPSYGTHAVYTKDWTYFGGDFGLYRFNNSSDKKEKIADNTSVSNLFLSGEWIYYNALDDDNIHQIYKVKIDGRQKKKLTEEYVTCLIVGVNNDYVFSTNYYSAGGIIGTSISRMNLDGSNKQVLVYASGGGKYLSDDLIYYHDNGELRQVNINSGEHQSFLKLKPYNSVNCFYTHDNCLFYIYDSSIYKTNLNTNAHELFIKGDLLNDNAIVKMAIANNKIYYSLNDGFWDADLNGKNRRRIVKFDKATIDSFDVVGGWIYYEVWKPIEKYYRIRLDGTDNQLLE